MISGAWRRGSLTPSSASIASTDRRSSAAGAGEYARRSGRVSLKCEFVAGSVRDRAGSDPVLISRTSAAATSADSVERPRQPVLDLVVCISASLSTAAAAARGGCESNRSKSPLAAQQPGQTDPMVKPTHPGGGQRVDRPPSPAADAGRWPYPCEDLLSPTLYSVEAVGAEGGLG